jgi:mRNA-degrading endonuclease RelE of RelBE toxin-antitoxin system
MTNKVTASKAFQKDAKTLVKKFHTLKYSIDKLILNLAENPYLGIPYGNKIYKIRLADKSKGSGKSGGFRVMYYHLNNTSDGIEILLITIYDKSNLSTVTKSEVMKRLTNVLDDLPSF